MTTAPTLRYRQPVVFGPSPGPRQNSQGDTYKSTLKDSTKTKTTVRFKTKASAIRALFPNEQYSLPDTGDDDFAYATWSLESLRNLSWLSGSGYDLLALYVEDVMYTDSHSGRRRHCTYNPLMIENFADPIMTGREELGVPKLFSDIDIAVDETENASSLTLKATVSWRGSTWMELRVPSLRQQHRPSLDTSAKTDTPTKTTPPHCEGLLVHKYIPSSGGGVNGKPDADYDVLIHNDPGAADIKTTSVADPSETKISIHNLGSQKLPTLCNVVDGLARIPILEIVDARMVEIQGMSDLSNLERLN
ncbi:hypothetical protein H2204_008254 [Knufia peltigerae]|uniref:Uncharacterized protein n=1 Tax=Knufia peltigerae TaxID=1002370 RepID=A0AA38Y0C6_9EURO|nr:hypothetical protein H2204_008254 [Knufia peltigerae]